MTTTTSPPANGHAPAPSLAPSSGIGGPWAVLFVLAVFGVLSFVVYINNGNPEIRRIDLVAQQYADAWENASLQDLDYDELSGPDVEDGNADQVRDNVRHIVHDLDGKGDIAPIKVEVDRSATERDATHPELATTRLLVTWDLQKAGLTQEGHEWTYPVTLQERMEDGRWRVVWSPESVHPAIRQGLVFRVQRSLAPRAPLIGAGDTLLPPDDEPDLAKALLGSITTSASEKQAELYPLTAAEKDTIGVSGLQDIYNERLAGGAQLTVTAGLAQGYKDIQPTQNPLFVGAPDTPTPVKLTLDRRTQDQAQAALNGVTGPTTLIVARASTGEVLAVANTSKTVNYGLDAQEAPGSLFQLTSYLALLRVGYIPSSQVDCREPYTMPGSGQMFRNPIGPKIPQVRLAAAIEGGCSTGLARLASTITPEDLQNAAWDLGITTPLRPNDRTPGWRTVTDQLGTMAYLGRVHSDSARDVGTTDDPDLAVKVSDVEHALDITGEGKVLVSPLSVTRATMTVARGTRVAPRLITDPAPKLPDVVTGIDPDQLGLLQDVMAKGVSEGGGSAHTLAAVPGSPIHAMASVSGYGTGRTDTHPAWVTGYRGDIAFTVLQPDSTTGTRDVLGVAQRFLPNVP